MQGESYFPCFDDDNRVTLQTNHGKVLTVLAILSVFVLLYSLIIANELLLGVLVVIAIGLVYLFFVFMQILDRVATALEAIADGRQGE